MPLLLRLDMFESVHNSRNGTDISALRPHTIHAHTAAHGASAINHNGEANHID
jgi:hypothetical protein